MTAPIITRVVMQAVPLIGFLTAAILIKVLAHHKKKIVKAFEVQPLPAQVRMELVYYYHAECRNSANLLMVSMPSHTLHLEFLFPTGLPPQRSIEEEVPLVHSR